jgi:thiamine pyrophosphokinase
MGKCIIFCAGGFDTLAEPIRDGDYVIAADGGLEHLKKIHRKPQAILGDFDSLGYVPEGAQVFPVEKDDTDSMLAVRRGLDLGYRQFVLYGALDGKRIDHTVANFQTLQFLADHGAQGYLVGCEQIATVVKNGGICLPGAAEGLISVFCMGPDAEGVTIEELQYSLTDGTLSAGFPLGVSNHFIGKDPKISVKNGSLLIIYDRKIGLPEVCHADL